MSEFIRDLDTYAAGRWIPWVGRVHPKRYARHLGQKAPSFNLGYSAGGSGRIAHVGGIDAAVLV